MEERSQKLFDNIEKYLNGTMSAEEVARFEAELKKNPKLQEEVEKHRDLHESLSDQELLAFKEKLIAIGEELKNEHIEDLHEINTPYDVTEKKTFFSWRIAAIGIVLIGLSSFFIARSFFTSKELDLFKDYFNTYPAEDIVRGDTTIDSVYISALESYANRDYVKAINFLESYKRQYTAQTGEEKTVEKIYFFLGSSYLHINNALKAVAEFEKIRKDNLYYEPAQWYLALSLLKLDELKKTETLLKEIIAYNGLYKNKASNLLKELEETI